MYELGLEARLGSCAVAEGRLNHALRNRQSRRCESKQDASAHAVLLQGMWLRAARARERVWDVRRVQLQVQLSAPLAMCSCGMLVTDDGIVTSLRLEHSRKANCAHPASSHRR